MANTIKYFSQTLLSEYFDFLSDFPLAFHLGENLKMIFSQSAVLKDVRNSPLDMIKDPEMDLQRMSSYPNLEYQNLYNAICMLVSDVFKL